MCSILSAMFNTLCYWQSSTLTAKACLSTLVLPLTICALRATVGAGCAAARLIMAGGYAAFQDPWLHRLKVFLSLSVQLPTMFHIRPLPCMCDAHTRLQQRYKQRKEDADFQLVCSSFCVMLW